MTYQRPRRQVTCRLGALIAAAFHRCPTCLHCPWAGPGPVGLRAGPTVCYYYFVFLSYYCTFLTTSSRHASHPKKLILFIRLKSKENLSAILDEKISKNCELVVEKVQYTNYLFISAFYIDNRGQRVNDNQDDSKFF
jgi:hypothetical protein